MKQTQCDRILRHLKDHGTLTGVTALEEYGIAHLASRITDLRQQGVEIRKEMKEGKNRYGEKTRYAVYSLEEKKC